MLAQALFGLIHRLRKKLSRILLRPNPAATMNIDGYALVTGAGERGNLPCCYFRIRYINRNSQAAASG